MRPQHQHSRQKHPYLPALLQHQLLQHLLSISHAKKEKETPGKLGGEPPRYYSSILDSLFENDTHEGDSHCDILMSHVWAGFKNDSPKVPSGQDYYGG